MKRTRIAALVATATLVLGATPVVAQTGGTTSGGTMGAGMMGGASDSSTAAIMRVVHQLLADHDKMRRTVTNLPNGIRTLTESDDPAVALRLKSHVALTGDMVSRSHDPNLPMSTPSVHGVLKNGSKITRSTQVTAKGVLVVETSSDSATVALLQQHAAEVTDLVNRGMVAAHEAMMKGGGDMGGMAGMMGGMGGMAGMSHDSSDRAFSALQERGKQAMGVDQYTSTHHFDATADGGRIELQRDVDDSAGVAQIRAHLRDIEKAFKAGNFTTPEFVHMQTVPGAKVMAAKRALITYTFHELPRGAELWITTKDKEAVAAVHEFLAFQQMDHRSN